MSAEMSAMTCRCPAVRSNGRDAMKSSSNAVSEQAEAAALREASRDLTSAVWQISASS